MDTQSTRFIVQRERPPLPKPRWWRGLYLVRDTAMGTVRDAFWRWGEADKMARCLNGDLGPFLCRDLVADAAA